MTDTELANRVIELDRLYLLADMKRTKYFAMPPGSNAARHAERRFRDAWRRYQKLVDEYKEES